MWGVTCVFLDLVTQVLHFLSPLYLYWLVCKWPETQASWKIQILHWFLKGEDSKFLEPEQKMVFQKQQRLREQRTHAKQPDGQKMEKETNFKTKNEIFIFTNMVAKYLKRAFLDNKHTNRKLRYFKKYFLECITHKLARRETFKNIKVRIQKSRKVSQIGSQKICPRAPTDAWWSRDQKSCQRPT